VSDWYNSRVPKLAANRVTVFFEDNKKGGVDQTVHLDVLYKADGMMMSFYLRVDPKYVACKQGPCLGYDHNVILRVGAHALSLPSTPPLPCTCQRPKPGLDDALLLLSNPHTPCVDGRRCAERRAGRLMPHLPHGHCCHR